MQAQLSTSSDRKHRFRPDFTKRIASFFRTKSSSTRQSSRNPSAPPRSARPSLANEPPPPPPPPPRSIRRKFFNPPTHPKEPVSYTVPSSHLRNGAIAQTPSSYLRSKDSHHQFDLSAPRSAPSRAFQITRIPGLPTSRSKRASSDNRSVNPSSHSPHPAVDAYASSAHSYKPSSKYSLPRGGRVLSEHSSMPVPQPYRPTDQSPLDRKPPPTSTRSSPIISKDTSHALQLRFETDRQVPGHRQRPDSADPATAPNHLVKRSSDTPDIIRPVPTKPKHSDSRSEPVSPARSKDSPVSHVADLNSWEPVSHDKVTRVPSRNLQALRDIEAQVTRQVAERKKHEDPPHTAPRRKSDKRGIGESHKASDADTDCDDTSSLSSAPTCVITASLPSRSVVVSKKEGLLAESANTSFSSPVEEYRALSAQGEQAAQALERIARIIGDFDDGGDEKGKESVIPILMEAINQYRQDPLVADRALTTLRRFTVSPKCRRTLGDAGAVESIAAIMSTHNLRVRIAAQGCLALGNLCYHEDANKERVLEHGITVIVAAMALHTEAEQTQAWGALALRNCTNSLDEEAEGPVGAVEVLVAALETYTKSEVVVSNALAALSNIARTKGKDAIVQAGGVSVLVSTLRANARNQRLSELGLSLCVGVIEDDAMCAFFGNQGGVEIVTSILDYHRGDTAISCLGSAVLRVLAFNAQNRKRFASCGTLRAVVAALSTVAAEEAPTKVNIVMKALANIAFDSSSMKVEAGKLRVIELAMSIMLRLSRSDLVAEAGMRVIRNLTDQNKENGAVLIGHPQGLANIAWIGRTHGTSSAGVAEHTIACLVNLSIMRRYAAVVKADAKIASLVQDLQAAHVNNRRVVGQALKLKSILDAAHKPKNAIRD